MSITLGGYNFETVLTHQLPMPAPYDYGVSRAQFFGVVGESEIRDSAHGRDIAIDCHFRGYSTWILAEAALRTIESKIGTLNGDLVVGANLSSLTFENTTFVSVQRAGPPFYDATGINDWTIQAMLIFRQLKRNA